MIELETVYTSPEESSLVAVKPSNAATVVLGGSNIAKKSQPKRHRARHDPSSVPDPDMMRELDYAVARTLIKFSGRQWSQLHLADALAMLPEVTWSGEHLRKRALTNLREDNTRVANDLYDADRRAWVAKSVPRVEELCREKWGDFYQSKLYPGNDEVADDDGDGVVVKLRREKRSRKG